MIYLNWPIWQDKVAFYSLVSFVAYLLDIFLGQPFFKIIFVQCVLAVKNNYCINQLATLFLIFNPIFSWRRSKPKYNGLESFFNNF